MSSAILPEQTLYSTTTFRCLLDSLARPGKINQLTYPRFLGEPPCFHRQTEATAIPVNLYALGALFTLLDRDVTFSVAADGQWLSPTTSLVQWLLLRSGATTTTPAVATFAFFCQGQSDGLLTQLNRGTLLEPEFSTTALYCVGRLTEWTSGLKEDSNGVTLELAGPGIERTRGIHVLGLERNEIQLIQITRQGYPLGIDIYLIDEFGHCAGLPRTTRIHLLGKEK